MKNIKKVMALVGLTVAAIGLSIVGYQHLAGKKVESRFVEGRHFRLLPQSYAANQNSVDNYYWLNCSTCYMFENSLRRSSKERGFDVHKIHATSNEKWLEDSKLDTTFRLLNRPQLIDSFYDVSNNDRSLIGDQSKINNFLDLYQVDRNQFWSTYNSPASLAKSLELSSNSALVDLRVVPTFVVSGKYKILLGGLKNNEELPDLIDYLILNQPEHNPELDEVE